MHKYSYLWWPSALWRVQQKHSYHMHRYKFLGAVWMKLKLYNVTTTRRFLCFQGADSEDGFFPKFFGIDLCATSSQGGKQGARWKQKQVNNVPQAHLRTVNNHFTHIICESKWIVILFKLCCLHPYTPTSLQCADIAKKLDGFLFIWSR